MDSSVKSAPDHYATLGVSPEASDQEVEQAFHARVLEHLQHPNAAEESGRQRARQVSLAYETLRDSGKRDAYDSSRRIAAEHMAPPTWDSQSASDGPLMFGAAAAAETAATAVPEASPFEEPAERSAVPLTAPDSVEPVGRDAVEPPAADFAEPEPLSGPVESPAASAAEPEPMDASVEPPAPGEAEPTVSLVEAPAAYAAEAEPTHAFVEAPAAYTDEPIEDADDFAEETGGRDIVEQEPRDNLPADVIYDREPRSSDMHRVALGAGALVIALGLGGLFLTRGGGTADERAGPPTAHVAVPPGQTQSAGPGTVASSAPEAATPPVDSAEVAQGTAPTLAPPLASAPSGDRLSTLTIPPAPSDVTSSTSTSDTASPAPASSTAASGSAGTSAAPSASPPTANAPANAQAAASPPPAAPAPVPPAARTGTPAHWVTGGLTNEDNPAGMYQGTVTVRFTVQPNGRVSECRPVASSGNGGLDASTCALVQQRLRFSPALDADGHAVPSEVRTTYSWGRTRRR